MWSVLLLYCYDYSCDYNTIYTLHYIIMIECVYLWSYVRPSFNEFCSKWIMYNNENTLMDHILGSKSLSI